jgi:hypothetical protein
LDDAGEAVIAVLLAALAVASPPACRGPDLAARLALQGATGAMEGGVTVRNRTAHRCVLFGRPSVWLIEHGSQLLVRIAPGPSTTGARRARPLTLRPGGRAFVRLRWSNWCGAASTRITVRLYLRTTKPLLPVRGATRTPRCDDRSSVSVVRVGPWERPR